MSFPICIFEDEKYRNFLPLVYMRPVYDLRCGILTLREKVEKYYGTQDLILHSRKYLLHVLEEENKKSVVNKLDADSILFINGRALFSKELADSITQDGNEEIFFCDKNIVAARLSHTNYDKLTHTNDNVISGFEKLDVKQTQIDAYLFEYPWHLIQKNGSEIINDLKLINIESSNHNFDGVHFINEKDIFIGKDVNIKPTVVLDASEGPVVIDDKAKVLPGSYIVGPAYIGKNSLVKANTQIYHETTIGPTCKVGGEIENSIIHSYSNKQHEGFLGHAYLGSWVNIGASSNNSDLKNDYSKIKMIINGEEVNTETNFMGLIMGDHSKCAINTMFNTGTVIGVSCNIYGSEFPPKYIPSFSWGGAERLREYHLRKAIEVAKIVKSRRNITMSINDLEMFKTVFDLTQKERKEIK